MTKTLLKHFGQSQTVQNPRLVAGLWEFLLRELPKTSRELEQKKYQFSAENSHPRTISNRELLEMAKRQQIAVPAALQKLLQKRAVRTISGVSPIGILTKPYPCPGRCVYCPTEDRMPKSYLSTQPAAARAVRSKFHPFTQVKGRIIALEQSGHPTSKLEVIVMGGTWSFLPHRYQQWYVREIFRAANQFSAENSTTAKNSLQNLQKINENADKRVIGLTLETRPDFINEKELHRMRQYGCTRIEIGVQTLDDQVQKLTKRGHDRRHVIRAMKLMKNYGFKVCFHLMPGLPGSTPAQDLEWMKEVFENPDFRPDFVKIYPCVVLPTAELKGWWEAGKYEPYDDATLIKLLVQWQTFVPEWTRVMRLMRDIPVNNILDGARFSNLRQILTEQPQKLRSIVGESFWKQHKLAENPWRPRDIRSREIGFADLPKISAENLVPKLIRRDYDASDGKEIFLSFETQDQEHLLALLRLRLPSGDASPQFFRGVFAGAALVRELHSYGGEVDIGEGQGLGQHRGLGKKLLQEAERIAREEWNCRQVTIIAGVGTRGYYAAQGYRLCNTYMVKKL